MAIDFHRKLKIIALFHCNLKKITQPFIAFHRNLKKITQPFIAFHRKLKKSSQQHRNLETFHFHRTIANGHRKMEFHCNVNWIFICDDHRFTAPFSSHQALVVCPTNVGHKYTSWPRLLLFDFTYFQCEGRVVSLSINNL